MTALELLSWLNRILFVALFVAVAWRATRQPTRANFNTALLFFGIAAAVVGSVLADFFRVAPPWLTGTLITFLNICPFAMLRLVDDFRGTPRWIQVGGAAIFAGLVALGLLLYERQPLLVGLATIVWFLLVGGYAAVTFAAASRRSRGLTRWRMAAVAVGAYAFIAAIVIVFGALFFPDLALITDAIAQVLALVAVVAFFLGFAPPAWLRRAWREPDLRAFLERSVRLSGVSDERALVLELERATADTLGTPGASLGLADADGETLRYLTRASGDFRTYPSDAFVGGRAFTSQRRIIVADTVAADPEHADAYLNADARVAIAVPVSAEGHRLGVLVAYGDRAPIFVEDDLWLVQLLADQTAVILEARRMAREAGELRSREEATMLKEEFLSAAAHDLRTPLTVLLGQAELIERRLRRDPEAPVDPAGIARIVRESQRLRDLVSQLLDAQRLDDVGPSAGGDPIDVRAVVESCVERFSSADLPIEQELSDEPLMVRIDRVRLEQVIDNLLENAGKYAPGGAPTEVRAWREGSEARISVIDHGIGIPAGERAMVFERFFRASNVQARSDTGLGLGLYICRRILEGHGGRIWIDETPGGGSTFSVAIPAEVPSDGVDADAHDDIPFERSPEARSDA